ncbi:aldo/keto reductase [Cellvibrio sp. KY-GH-1]|uniref:aldo/keto reductase n=1 Tax=Cellvibrio sp. KY-GH-1 TaxID=2303332 RepID=UPI001CD99753|nr:aldo/keto reductase [Cellvibrio sp. KY-GH-1]
MAQSKSLSFRALGATEINLSLLGFGAAPIGNLYQPLNDVQAQAAVGSALSAGIRYFDTAPHYGFGLSEQRLGTALKQSSEAVVISSKVGRVLVPTESTASVRHGFADAPPLEPVFDYSYDGVMRSFEASLKRLQVEQIDVLLAHDLGPLTHGADHPEKFREFMDGGYLAMNKLKADGLVKAIGLGANEWQICDAALRHGDFDGFLLAGRYTLLEQAPCEHFFPLCAKRKASVILGGPFNSGILATGVKAALAGQNRQILYYNYEPASVAIVDRVARIEAVCDEFAVPLAAAALQFPAAHPQICSVLAGLANSEQVERAVSLINSEIPSAFWDALRERELLHPAAPIPVTN